MTAEPLPCLPSGRLQGREEFQQLVRQALAWAATQGCKELVLSDADFWDWPLGERAVIDSLDQWAHQGHRLTLLARSYDEIVRRHPRFVRWRGIWDHKVNCRRSAQAAASDIPSALWTPSWALQRLDTDRCVVVCGSDAERRVLLKENLDEWVLRRSSPGFAATTLGL